MSFKVEFSHQILGDPLIDGMGSDGFTQLGMMLAYSGQHGTDGFVPKNRVFRLYDIPDPHGTVVKLCGLGVLRESEEPPGYQVVGYVKNEPGGSSLWGQDSAEWTRKEKAKHALSKRRQRAHGEGDHSMCKPRYCPKASASSMSRVDRPVDKAVDGPPGVHPLPVPVPEGLKAQASSAAGPSGPLATDAADHGGQSGSTLVATVHGFEIHRSAEGPLHEEIKVEWPLDDERPDVARADALTKVITSHFAVSCFGLPRYCTERDCEICSGFRDGTGGWPLNASGLKDHADDAITYIKQLLEEYATAQISDPEELEH